MNPHPDTAPDAGRNRPVSLDAIRDLPDPQPRPGDEMDDAELSSFAPDAGAAAASLLIAVAGVLPPVERESLLYLLRPHDETLRGRSRIAGCSPDTLKKRALRMRAAMADGLNSDTAGNPRGERATGGGDGFE